MSTTSSVFGHASAFCAVDDELAVATASGHLAAIRRHLQSALVHRDPGRSSTSPGATISSSSGGAAGAPGALTRGTLDILTRSALASNWPALFVRPSGTELPASVAPAAPARTAAQDLVELVQARSGLVLEEMAALLGTSRRTLQNWKAGEAISASNDRRLRDVADALGRMGFADKKAARRALFDRVEDEVRTYDLLAEGSYEVAVARVRGVKPPLTGAVRRPEPGADLRARLDPAPDVQPLRTGTPSARRLRRPPRG